jgi:hypothetical protein
MTYEEFEWRILRMVYEDGLDRLQPAYLAYSLELSHEKVNEYLDRAVQNNLLEMNVTEEGQIDYEVLGVDRDRPVPKPIWKEAFEEEFEEKKPQSDRESRDHAPVTTEQNRLPDVLKEHIQKRYTNAEFEAQSHSAIVETDASIENSKDVPPTKNRQITKAQEAYNKQTPIRVEANEEAFCDPSQTVLMRQLRVTGVESKALLKQQVQNLFESVGYNVVETRKGGFRLERGSVAFILALVPLFVLILPLFVYLLLYCMGRSTIQQEPLELDVQFREVEPNDVYEVDLTFIGLHGVVLGSADQKVLNQEVENLQEELRWALPHAQ